MNCVDDNASYIIDVHDPTNDKARGKKGGENPPGIFSWHWKTVNGLLPFPMIIMDSHIVKLNIEKTYMDSPFLIDF